ncbi:MAG: ABC transporter permease [Acidimicrobiia bacterium]|nr:ABC transporter permease [Acidimicrobiia bacterium]
MGPRTSQERRSLADIPYPSRADAQVFFPGYAADTSLAPPQATGRGVPLSRLLVLRSKPRFLLAAGTGTLVVALVVLQLAVMAGMKSTSTWVNATGAELWAIREGAGVYANIRPISDAQEAGLAGVTGVEAVIPATTWTASFLPIGREPVNAILNAWEPGALNLDLVTGRAPDAVGEIVVDTAFARAYGLDLGNHVALSSNGNERRTTVVGTTRGASLLVFQNVFTTPETIEAFRAGTERNAGDVEAAITELSRLAQNLRAGAADMRASVDSYRIFDATRTVDAVAGVLEDAAARADAARASLETFRQGLDPSEPTYLALRLAPSADPTAVITSAAKTSPDLTLLTPDAFRSDIEASSVGPFIPIFASLAVAAVLVGTLVLGMTLSIMVTESTRDYALLRSLGTTRGRLRRVVLGQGSYLVGTALVCGLGLGAGLVVVGHRVMPLLPTTLTPVVFVGVIAVAAVMLVVSSLIPVRRVQRVDPVVVFRS